MKSEFQENFLTDKLNEKFEDHSFHMVLKVDEKFMTPRKYIVMDDEVTSISWDPERVSDSMVRMDSETVEEYKDQLIESVIRNVEVAILYKEGNMSFEECVKTVEEKYND